MMSNVDLQNHWTTKSRVLTPDSLSRHALNKLGRNGIVGLVNYGDRRYEACAELAESCGLRNVGNALIGMNDQVMIVKGEEVPTRAGDLLVIGTRKGTHLTPKRSLHYSVREAKDNGGIVVITTPYFRSNVGEIIEFKPDLWEYVDAVEVHNGNVGALANQKAEDLYFLARAMGRPIGCLASSDGHSYGEVGTSYSAISFVDLSSLSTDEGVVNALKVGLRDTQIKDLHKQRNVYGPALHTAIIGSMIASEKLPKKLQNIWPVSAILNRGDLAALR